MYLIKHGGLGGVAEAIVLAGFGTHSLVIVGFEIPLFSGEDETAEAGAGILLVYLLKRRKLRDGLRVVELQVEYYRGFA